MKSMLIPNHAAYPHITDDLRSVQFVRFVMYRYTRMATTPPGKWALHSGVGEQTPLAWEIV